MPDISKEDLAQHSKRGDLWIALEGQVYDVSRFAPQHPGGEELIVNLGGKDATAAFKGMHPTTYIAQYLDKPLGVLTTAPPPPPAKERTATPPTPPTAASPTRPTITIPHEPPSPVHSAGRWFKTPTFAAQPPAPSPKAYVVKMTLLASRQISHNTVNYHFKVQGDVVLDPGQHVYFTSGGVRRPYTPISVAHSEGATDLVFVIKLYEKGAMSGVLRKLQKGDILSGEVRPFTKFRYASCGWYFLGAPLKAGEESTPRHARCIGMVAGGTGITPMFSVMRSILGNLFDTTVMYLLFANQSVDDILMRAGLEKLQKEYPERLKIWFTVDSLPPQHTDTWRFSTGFISKEMLQFLPSRALDLCLICGPPPMSSSVQKILSADEHFEAEVVVL